eukprot:gene10895-17016_t
MSSSFVEWNTSKRCQVDSSIPHLPMEIMMQIFDTAEAITWTSTRALRDSATCKLLKSLRFRFGPLMLAKVCDPMNMFLFKRILVSEEYNEDLDIEAAMLNACQAGCVEALKAFPARADAQDSRALSLASKYGRSAVVKLLLDAKAFPARADAQESLALVLASQNGHTAVVKLLKDAK